MHAWARRQILAATAVPLAMLLPRLARADQPGDHIVLAAGDFAGGDLTVTRGGSNDRPYLVRQPRDGGRSKDLRPYCRGVRLTGNEAGQLIVGKVIKQFGERYSMPAVDTRIASHKCPIEYELETGTGIDETARVAASSPRKLSPADVGPDAEPSARQPLTSAGTNRKACPSTASIFKPKPRSGPRTPLSMSHRLPTRSCAGSS